MISRRSSPRRRWAGLTVMSVIIRSGSESRPVLIALSQLEYVATGIAPGPIRGSASQAPRIVTSSERTCSSQAARKSSLGRGCWNPRCRPSTQPVTRSSVGSPSLPTSRIANSRSGYWSASVTPPSYPARFDEFGEQLFTQVMANSGTIPWERVRRAGAKLTTPLHPDDYLRLINPLWSSRELRGRIERVIPETDDAATLVIRPGWGWRYDHRPGQYVGIGVQVEGRFQWRSYSVSSPPEARPRHHRDHRARDAGGAALRPPGQGPGAGHDRAPGAAGGRLRAA